MMLTDNETIKRIGRTIRNYFRVNMIPLAEAGEKVGMSSPAPINIFCRFNGKGRAFRPSRQP